LTARPRAVSPTPRPARMPGRGFFFRENRPARSVAARIANPRALFPFLAGTEPGWWRAETAMGKYSKKNRFCPALDGRPIKPAECGARRGSDLACPAECAFNPFGTAAPEAWVKVEKDWLTTAVKRLMNRWETRVFKQRLSEAMAPLARPESRMEHALENLVHREYFFPRDPGGRTEADRWEAEGFPGLNNDGRVLVRHYRKMRPTMIEVRRIEEEAWCEGVDLLRPETPPVRVFDPFLAASITPPIALLGWLVPGPHYQRITGVVLGLPVELWESFRARLEARHAEARAERPDLGFTAFLAEHMPWAGAELLRLREMGDFLAPSTFYYARYLRKAPEETLLPRLEAAPDFAPAEEEKAEGESFFRWKPRTGPGAAPDKNPSEPRLWFEHGELRLLAHSAEARQALRERVEELLGEHLAFVKEFEADLENIMAEHLRREQIIQAAQQAGAPSVSPEDAATPRRP